MALSRRLHPSLFKSLVAVQIVFEGFFPQKEFETLAIFDSLSFIISLTYNLITKVFNTDTKVLKLLDVA